MEKSIKIILLFLISFSRQQDCKSQFSANFNSSETVKCLGSPIVFNSICNPSNAIIWWWDFGDGQTSNDENPIHFYNSTGIFTVKLIASNGIDIDTIIKPNYITISLPQVNFTYNIFDSTVNFTNSSFSNTSNIYLYVWDFGDGTYSSEVNPIHTYSSINDTCYDVSLSVQDNNGCMSVLHMYNVFCTNFIEKHPLENLKILFSENQINIDGINKIFDVNIYSISGENIYEENNIKEIKKQIKINESANMIFIQIVVEGEVFYYRLLKEI